MSQHSENVSLAEQGSGMEQLSQGQPPLCPHSDHPLQMTLQLLRRVKPRKELQTHSMTLEISSPCILKEVMKRTRN